MPRDENRPMQQAEVIRDLTAAEIRAFYEIWTGLKPGMNRAVDALGFTDSPFTKSILLAADNTKDLIEETLDQYCETVTACVIARAYIGAVRAAALVAEIQMGTFDSVEAIYRVCGLSGIKPLSYKHAMKLIQKHCPWLTVRELGTGWDGYVNSALKAISDKTGKPVASLRRENGMPPSQNALLRWLTDRPFSKYLSTLCNEIGEVIRTKDPYAEVWSDALKEFHSRNEAGEYAEAAKRKLSDANRDRINVSQFASLTVGRLPDEQLSYMASQVVQRKFLAEVWKVLKS